VEHHTSRHTVRWLRPLIAAVASPVQAAHGARVLGPGERLTGGQYLLSSNGRHRLAMQTDGNLVLYRPDGAYSWQTDTDGHPGAYVDMQPDGNLVVYRANGTFVWQTNTVGRAGARLELQNDGNLVLYQGGAAIWQSNTVIAQHSLPLPRSAAPRSQYDDPHHDYATIDIEVPTGTPAVAVASGAVQTFYNSSCGNGATLTAPGAVFTYCHFSAHRVASGSQVSAGQQIGDTGSTGSSTGPHLHLEIGVGGGRRCPQPWLLAVFDGATPPPVTSLPTSGCSF
jgi:hypothetical protein